MPKRVLIATGGTGGHLFPAQSLAKELDGEVLFVGKGLSSNPYFSDYPFEEIASGRRPIQIGRGILAAWKVLRKFRPDVVVGFGSWYAFPTLMAAKFLKLPMVLHEANAWPGRVNRFFSSAAVTGIHFPQTKQYLKGPVVDVSMPVRHPYREMSKASARRYFGLEPDRFTLLVFGGSYGAESLKEPAERVACAFDAQVIHLYGHGTKPTYERGYVASFEQEMGLAWCAADLSITRSGASTLAEQIEWEVPSVLVPWPDASEDHQTKNADAMVELGCALKWCGGDLIDLISGLDRQKMIENIRQFKGRKRLSFAELVNG